MTTEITMPKLSDTMEAGTILKWRVTVGQEVARGDIIAEVETDKAVMEMEAYEEGMISSLAVAEGESVAVGTVIAVLGGAVRAEAALEPAPARQGIPVSAAGPEAEAPPPEAAAAAKGTPKVTVSPAARRLAREQRVELAGLKGSGPAGRIVLADVERAALPKPVPSDEPEGVPSRPHGSEKSVRIRRIIARKMEEAWESIPHFFVTVAVDMTDVIRFRKSLGVTINDFILAATARSLVQHPWVNSHWADGEAVEQPQVNIAMAVATEHGLFNPILADCGGLPIKGIHRQAAELAELAHQGKLSREMMEGGTFTISNMGMLGVESFSAIITPPQAAVLAVGTVKGEVVVDESGEPGIATVVRLTLSADHRILDGADAADFLDTLKSFLEAPVTLVAGDE